MKIVVIGGTGLIGSKVVAKLTEHGHEAVPASPDWASTRSPAKGSPRRSTARPSSSTFRTRPPSSTPRRSSSSRRRRATCWPRKRTRASGITSRCRSWVRRPCRRAVTSHDDRRYFRAKLTQEKLIKASSIPYTIVHATQFFEFVKTSPTRPPTAARSVCRRCSSSPWRPTTSRARGPGRRRHAGERHHRDRRAGAVPDRRASCGVSSPPTTTHARS